MARRVSRHTSTPPIADQDQPIHVQLGTDDPTEQARRVFALRQMAITSPITVVVQYDPRSDTIVVSPIGHANTMTVLDIQQILIVVQQKLVQTIQDQQIQRESMPAPDKEPEKKPA